MGRTAGQVNGQHSKAGQRAGRQGKTRAGWARKVNGQDGQGWFMGRMDVVSNGLDNKKLDANSSGLSPGRDIQTINGTAQSEIILSGHLDYKQARLLDSPGTRATLSTVMAHPGCQQPNNWIHGQD